jgi:hypothetical protein
MSDEKPALGSVHVNPKTGTVAVFRNGNELTGPMWFLVPQDDDCRWARAGEYTAITYVWSQLS